MCCGDVICYRNGSVDLGHHTRGHTRYALGTHTHDTPTLYTTKGNNRDPDRTSRGTTLCLSRPQKARAPRGPSFFASCEIMIEKCERNTDTPSDHASN